MSIPPVVVIADPDQGAWAVAAGRDAAQLATGRLGADAHVSTEAVELSVGPSAGEWRLAGGSSSLAGTPLAADVGTGDEQLALTTVSGSLKLDDGSELHVDGGRGVDHPGFPELQADTIRMLGAWFTPAQWLAILSVRPPRARGHDKDAISVAAVGETDGASVFDPRLSSTYGPGESLRRAGVELWLGADKKEDLRSWRIAGEADGAPARLQLDGLSIQAQPLRCHSRGETGIGVYLLISTRPAAAA